ncbi:MAG: CsgG/HfaB family protein, partial [Nitrospinales bacterium]
DQTGQFKARDVFTNSTSVTQGATSMLIKALRDVGGGEWFKVLEREGLNNLLNERKIIRQTRKQYIREGGNAAATLPPLLFSGVLLEGGVIAYESNLLTGGVGAEYFGAGGSAEFQRDAVTIYLRMVSVKTGEILETVNARKTIFSLKVDAGITRFISFNRLLEAEVGFTTNEPPQMAVLEAIETAVYSLIMEGINDGLWSFKNPKWTRQLLRQYFKEKQGRVIVKLDKDGKFRAVKSLKKKRRKKKTLRRIKVTKRQKDSKRIKRERAALSKKQGRPKGS